MKFDTKLAVVLRDDLATWQALNVTAFTAGGVVGSQGLLGESYQDASGVRYLPMSRQPILIFQADREAIRRAFERATRRQLAMSIYTEELFSTGHDAANRAAVRAVATEALELVGLAVFGRRRDVDKSLAGLTLHP